MADPIFSPEAAPSTPPKRGMSSGVKIAIGCGVLMLIGFGSCLGGVVYCGKKVTGAGDDEWSDLRKVANDLGTDAGAQAQYQSHPGLSEAYPTADDFVGAARLWRPNLEPLPEARPPIFGGKLNLNTQYLNGVSKVTLAYDLGSGKRLIGTWKNKQLIDLQLE